MWRYFVGGLAALLMAGAGVFLFQGSATPEPLPSPPAPRTSQEAAPAEELTAVPEAPERSREEKRFDRNDKDKNSLITLAELYQPRRKAFAKLDKNGDGRLTMEEFMGPEAGDSDQVERRIEKIIEDNGESAARDGREPDELVIVAETFAVLLPPEDGDVDGQWGVEMQASRSIKGGDRSLTEDVMDPRLEEFAGMDTNGDGDVSLAEFQARMRALFTRGFELLDENGDGALTKAEFAVSADGQALLRRSPTGIDQDGDPGPVETLSDVQVEAGFAAMDKNGDAGLSLKEYLSAI